MLMSRVSPRPLQRSRSTLNLAAGLLAAALLLAGSAAWAQGQNGRKAGAACPGCRAPAEATEVLITQLRDAARNFEADRVAQLASRIPADHVLAPYGEFWTFRTRYITRGGEPTGQVSDAELQAFLKKWDGTFMADRIRNDWLLILGKHGDWATFDAEFLRFVLQDDNQVSCYALQSRLRSGAGKPEDIAREADELMDRNAQAAGGDGCVSLTLALAESGAWGPSDLWQRIRQLHEASQVSASKRVAPALPSDQRPTDDQLDAVFGSATRYIATQADYETRRGRELAALALSRIARQDAEQASENLVRQSARKLGQNEAAYVRLQYAAACARRTWSSCSDWLKDLKSGHGTDDTMAWAARAALRDQDFPALARVLALMNPSQRNEPTWTYWNARTLRSLGAPREDWVAQLDRIKGGWDFYGLLAREDLGEKIVIPPKTLTFTEEDVQEASRSPHVARAFAFFQAGLRFEGNREWNWQMRSLPDAKLAAYAEYARRQGHLDRMINASERTREAFDFTQRYPTPFVEELAPIAKNVDLDIAWVYGLIRQESRFIMDARSSAGAQGLMQLMPGTARYVAKKIGMDYDPAKINTMTKNLTLGSNYLAMVLRDLDGSPALASAAYNAGPGRPRAWRASLRRTVDGAAFAETIPFTETRGYVKAVLANAVVYAAVMGQENAPSLTRRLGHVHPKEAGTTTLP